MNKESCQKEKPAQPASAGGVLNSEPYSSSKYDKEHR